MGSDRTPVGAYSRFNPLPDTNIRRSAMYRDCNVDRIPIPASLLI